MRGEVRDGSTSSVAGRCKRRMLCTRALSRCCCERKPRSGSAGDDLVSQRTNHNHWESPSSPRSRCANWLQQQVPSLLPSRFQPPGLCGRVCVCRRNGEGRRSGMLSPMRVRMRFLTFWPLLPLPAVQHAEAVFDLHQDDAGRGVVPQELPVSDG